MIIIIEGENKTGKSTLANYLKNYFHFKLIKCSQPKKDAYVEYMKKLRLGYENIVFDRFHIGELVYGPIFRGKSQLDDKKVRNIELAAMSKNAIIIYCTDKPEIIKRRFITDNETFSSVKHVDETLVMFDQEIKNSILPVLTHQIKEHDLIFNNKLTNTILSFRKFDKKFNSQIIGNTVNPRLVLVGEKRNKNKRYKYQKVYQPFDFGPSSRFLFNALGDAKIDLSNICILNSDNPQLKMFLTQLNDKIVVIALGKIASKVLTAFKIKHTKLNHPQYENRFRHHYKSFSKSLNEIYHKGGEIC